MLNKNHPMTIPAPGPDGIRRYNKCWFVRLEDTRRCVAAIYDKHRMTEWQCSRKRGHGKDGLLCKQHHRMMERNNG